MRPDDFPSRPGEAAGDETVGDANAVGDANIERLLSRVYQPETPAADFVARVERAVAAAAEARREAATVFKVTLARTAPSGSRETRQLVLSRAYLGRFNMPSSRPTAKSA